MAIAEKTKEAALSKAAAIAWKNKQEAETRTALQENVKELVDYLKDNDFDTEVIRQTLEEMGYDSGLVDYYLCETLPTPDQMIEAPQLGEGISATIGEAMGIPDEMPQEPSDVAIMITTFLNRHTPATTAELREAAQCSSDKLNKVLNDLIEDGTIERIKRGVYQLTSQE